MDMTPDLFASVSIAVLAFAFSAIILLGRHSKRVRVIASIVFLAVLLMLMPFSLKLTNILILSPVFVGGCLGWTLSRLKYDPELRNLQ